jgi:type VI secretion system protein ImpA
MNSAKKKPALRFADLLEPVSADQPCGPDLEYDRDFVMLQAATAPKADTQYGDFVGTPDPINWAEVERDSRALLLRTKDIRLIVLLMRSRIRLSGAEGLRDGLELLKAMLQRYPEQCHPSLIDQGERDPVMHANALAGLAEHSGLLADVRNISLPKAAGMQLQLRDIEKSMALPRIKDALAPESVQRLLKELSGKRDKHLLALSESQLLCEEIIAGVDHALGEDAPELEPLSSLLQPFGTAVSHAATSTPPTAQIADYIAEAGETVAAASTSAPPPIGTPDTDLPESAMASSANDNNTPSRQRMDRWTALAAVQDVRNWFEQNEPSSPVIVLLRQAERMVGKRFSELAHIIPADLLAKWDEADE